MDFASPAERCNELEPNGTRAYDMPSFFALHSAAWRCSIAKAFALQITPLQTRFVNLRTINRKIRGAIPNSANAKSTRHDTIPAGDSIREISVPALM